jgi:hypothetical protein
MKLNNILSHYDGAISLTHHLYIVRSQFFCTGCVQHVYLQLENKPITSNPLSITVISYDKNYISKSFLSKVVFINDTLKLINREFQYYANITFFETNKGRVIKCKNLGDAKDLDLPQFVNDFFEKNKIIYDSKPDKKRLGIVGKVYL